MAADVEFLEGGRLVVIRCTKAQLVLSRQQFADALKWGKRLRRQQALQARQSYQEGGDDGSLVR